MVCILGSFHVRTLGNRNLGSARSSSHPLPQRLQHSQGILPILEVQVDFVGTAAPQPNNRSVLRLVSDYAHKVSLTVFIVDNSLHFVKNFSRFVLKGLATHVYNSLSFLPRRRVETGLAPSGIVSATSVRIRASF
jgi:hypothetical protein